MLPTPTSVSFDTQALNNNKENVIIHPLRNSNGRRPRTRRANTPSPIYLAREAARDPRRRRTLSPPVLTQKQSMHLALDNDMDIDMGDMRSPELQRTLQLPRRLNRPIFKAISPEALEAVDPDLKGVALEYLREKLELVGAE
ncbi:MAG TPA: hypothetical protein VGO47_05135 [Chlamydiales bacterium]|nr:hypothetical protein [Chlamydiales bacterium]